MEETIQTYKIAEVVQALNEHMISKNSVVRFKKDGYSIDIVVEDEYIKDHILNMQPSFYEEIEAFLRETFQVHSVTYNNTGSCFWNLVKVVK